MLPVVSLRPRPLPLDINVMPKAGKMFQGAVGCEIDWQCSSVGFDVAAIRLIDSVDWKSVEPSEHATIRPVIFIPASLSSAPQDPTLSSFARIRVSFDIAINSQSAVRI
jgi:hypothetical protein